MVDKISENVCFVLDTSRSMARTDYTPNRLDASKSAILKYIQARSDNDSSTGFALVVFNTEAKKLIDFAEGKGYEEFLEEIEDIRPGGSSCLGDAIGVAIQIHIEQLRLSGAKVPRIVIFSDGKYTASKLDPLKMGQLSQQLSIKIDCFRLGEVEHFNIMKRLSDLTQGKYEYSNDSANLMLAVQELAESNYGAMGEGYTKSAAFTAVLKKIAAPLLTVQEMSDGGKQDLIDRLRGTKQYNMCAICFSSQCMTCKSDFGVCGRYCPNCGTPMHIHCAAGWAAANNKESGGTIFRCPHCFYLVKVPKEVVASAKIHQELKSEIRKSNDDEEERQYFCKTVIANTLGDAALYSACPVCNSIFDENEAVIPCGNPKCNAVYHKDCFPKLPNMICKSCGSKLMNRF